MVTNLSSPSEPTPLDAALPVTYPELAPDTSFVSPGFEYLTDERALPARVRGALRIAPPNERVRHATAQGAIGRAGGPQFHGGHIVAVSLGGFASGPNLMPQNHNFNVSAYARLEHGWREALRGGLSVEVDIALTLDPDPAVPQFVVVTYWENGEEWEHVFINEADAQ
jgi:hypothetical protein